MCNMHHQYQHIDTINVCLFSHMNKVNLINYSYDLNKKGHKEFVGLLDVLDCVYSMNQKIN